MLTTLLNMSAQEYYLLMLSRPHPPRASDFAAEGMLAGTNRFSSVLGTFNRRSTTERLDGVGGGGSITVQNSPRASITGKGHVKNKSLGGLTGRRLLHEHALLCMTWHTASSQSIIMTCHALCMSAWGMQLCLYVQVCWVASCGCWCLVCLASL